MKISEDTLKLFQFLFVFVFLSSCQAQQYEQEHGHNSSSYEAYKASLLLTQDERFDTWGVQYHPTLESIGFDEQLSDKSGTIGVSDENGLFAFYYIKDEKLRLAAIASDHWYSWEMGNANHYRYETKLSLADIDGHGRPELIAEQIEYLQPQSTVGSHYDGYLYVFDTDLFNLYFDAYYLNFADDYGRNGDQSFEYLCQMEWEISVDTLELFPRLTTNGNKENVPSSIDECGIDSGKLGQYELQNFALVKVE